MTMLAVENALRAWVKTASGYPDARLFYNDQKIERPADPYFTIRLDALVPFGAVDAVRDDYDALRPVGQEMQLQVVGERTVTVRLQVFNAATTGAGSAMSLMSAVQLAIGLPTIRETLNVAGVSPFDIGSVDNLGALLGTTFDGRAALSVRCYIRETLSEYTTWIEKVQGTILGVPYEVEE